MRFNGQRSRRAALGAALLATAAGAGWAAPAIAQQAQQPSPPPAPTIGPDALRDFSIQPQRRIVTQPRPTATPPAATPPPAAGPTTQPTTATPEPGRSRPVANPVAPTPSPRTTPQPVIHAPIAGAPPQLDQSAPAPQNQPTPLPTAPDAATTAPANPAPPATAPAAASGGAPIWVYALGGATLLFGGVLVMRRRRRPTLALPAPDEPTEETHEQAIPQPSLPRVPRPDPVPRPWIELDLVAERATADAQESVVEFALTIRNSGGSAARNLKLQAKLICGTLTQDEEIAAFQRKKPGEHRTISLPDLPAGEEITIQGRVDSKGEDLKALRVEQKLLFIPLVAVNAHYDWNSSRSGQTSKSFLVGREKPDPAERMAPFRLDLGPRVYRTVGQRPYKIQRRV